MAKTIDIRCDNCDNELNETGNCVDYRLSLKNERIPSWGGGTVTAMMICPIIEQDAYFCGWHCFTVWVNKENNGSPD